jgi:hypothetical protein
MERPRLAAAGRRLILKRLSKRQWTYHITGQTELCAVDYCAVRWCDEPKFVDASRQGLSQQLSCASDEEKSIIRADWPGQGRQAQI